MDDEAGATIQLWRAPNRIWPGFPALVLVRGLSRLIRGRDQGRSTAPGEGGVVSVFLDGSKIGTLSPKQIELYQVSPGDHVLSLHFLGGLRRSKKLPVRLTKGEQKQIVCFLNAFGWPSIRPATPDDAAAVERLRSGSPPDLTT